MEKNTRIQELEALIKKHQDLYYNAEPEISDADFDLLWDELRSLDPRNALFATVPFNIVKGIAVSGITVVLYKKLSIILRRQAGIPAQAKAN